MFESKVGLKGYTEIYVTRAKTGKTELVFAGPNTISADLKEQFRDTMNSNVDFALNNMQATQVENSALSAGENTKDAIVIGDGDPASAAFKPADPTHPQMMATAVHPSDPSGNYYRQWQGIYQNLLSGNDTISGAVIGFDYLVTLNSVFNTQYATQTFAAITLQQNDILTVNWKISVG